MKRSVASLRKIPSVQQFLKQALPLEKQKNIDKPTRDRESFALEGKQKGHCSPLTNKSK